MSAGGKPRDRQLEEAHPAEDQENDREHDERAVGGRIDQAEMFNAIVAVSLGESLEEDRLHRVAVMERGAGAATSVSPSLTPLLISMSASEVRPVSTFCVLTMPFTHHLHTLAPSVR